MAEQKLITKRQYKHIISMFKLGAIFDVVLSHLELTHTEAFKKTNIHSAGYDELFTRAVELGKVHSSAYWFSQKYEGDPRIWMTIMKNNFGWSGGNPRGVSNVTQTVLNPDDPAKTLDNIVQAIANDEISAEKGKAMQDIIINSYQVRCIADS